MAVGSRNPDTDKAKEEGFLPVSVDLANVESVKAAFALVQKSLGIPNVVVYNAAALTFPSNFEDPFGVSPEAFVKDLGVNVSGVYFALNETVKGFKQLAAEIPKAFIATGNVLPFFVSPVGVTLGTGKAALTHLISIGATAYRESKFRFYFASQVTDEGSTVQKPDLNGAAHGLVYWKLVNESEQGDWDVRFVGNGELSPSRK